MRRLQGRSFFYVYFCWPERAGKRRERARDRSIFPICVIVLLCMCWCRSFICKLSMCRNNVFFFRQQNNNNTYAINHIFNYIIHRLQLQSIMQANKCRSRSNTPLAKKKCLKISILFAAFICVCVCVFFSSIFHLKWICCALCLQSISFYLVFLPVDRIARYFFFFLFLWQFVDLGARHLKSNKL